MAIVGAAPCVWARVFCGLAGAWLRAAGLKSLAPKLLAACAISISVAGCARNPPQREFNPVQHEVKAPPVRAVTRAALRTRRHAEPHRYAEPRVRRPDASLLSPQPAPDCEFGKPNLKTFDPDEWARLKVEYERQCYQAAEQVARERLSLLQTSIESDRPRTPVR